MKINKGNSKKHDTRLRNYSQTLSLNKLSDEDSEITSQITAGGDELELKKDIGDNDETYVMCS